MTRLLAWSLASCLLVACAKESAPEARVEVPENAQWLVTGAQDERWVKTAKHLRGLDVAMIEVGHRYEELYFAGGDQNWEYAEYQLGKLMLAAMNAVERRPKRADTAKMIDAPIFALRKAISDKDGPGFDAAFTQLTAMCNACHQAEQVGFMQVTTPTARPSVIRKPAAAPAP